MPPAITDIQLDRLVDGELTATDRRDLLLRLETEPDGWRRCALAFLEAQAWREVSGEVACAEDVLVRVPTTLPELGEGASGHGQNHPRPIAIEAKEVTSRRRGTLWGLAAGWLLMFAAGWWWAGGSGTQLARETAEEVRSASSPQNVAEPTASSEMGQRANAVSAAVPVMPGEHLLSPAAASPGEATFEQLQYPLSGKAALTEAGWQTRWQRLLDVGLSAEVAAELVEVASHVESYETVVQVPLDDGWSALVPVRFINVELDPAWNDYL